MKRKMISLLTASMLFVSGMIAVSAAVIHEVIEEKELFGGVTYQHIQRLESAGWQDIHVVQADLKAPGVKLKVLKSSKGESYMETVSNLAKEAGALAAINADFFAAKRGESGRGSAVGMEVRDGELKSSASVAESMNTLYKMFGDDSFYVDAFVFDITVKATNGNTDKIKLVNKYDDLTGIVMYTDDWAKTSVGSIGGIIEVAVDKNGTVVQKVTEAEPIEIPEDGYVLSAHMSYNTFLLDHVHVGDRISIDIKSTPNLERIETAVGGGGILVSEGKAQTSFSHNVSGKNPRSAVGIDKSGTVITLVAVDGRRSDAKGMTQTELGNLMVQLGCYTALNFDGGGSTAMAVEQQVVNRPSNGTERKVTNALGIVTDAKENAPVTAIKILCNDTVFAKTALPLEIVATDRYKREVSVDKSRIGITSSGGKIDGTCFFPNAPGTYAIKVSYGSFTAQKEITVLESPREIHFAENKVNLKSSEIYHPVLVGTDENGFEAQIRLTDTTLTSSKTAVEIAGESVTGKTKGSTILTATLGELTANMAVMVDGAEEIGVPDNQEKPDAKNVENPLYAESGYRFAVFGNTRESKTMFDRFLMNKAMHKMRANSKFQVFLGADIFPNEIERVCTDYVTAKNYNCFGDDVSTFITLPNVSGTVYNGDASVWTKFQNDVKGAGKNLFIFIDRNFISNRQAELLAFERIVNEAAEKGKNVYVFGGGFVNKNGIRSRVRYVNTAGIFPSIAIDGTSPSYIKYVLVTVNGTDVTFQYKPIIGE